MPAPTHLGPDRELEEAEIEVLNEIVLRASQSSDSDIYTWRAVYRAYKDVLQEHGLDEDQDSIFLRFLLLLRERQIANPIPTLDAHFIQLLLDNGIVLRRAESDVFSEDGSHYAVQSAISSRYEDPIGLAKPGDGDHSDVTIALERFGRPLDDVLRAARKWVPPPPRHRRASLTSLKDNLDPVTETVGTQRRASFSQVEEETAHVHHAEDNLSMNDGQRSHRWQSSMLANASSPSAPAARSTKPLSQITLLDEPEDWDLHSANPPWRAVKDLESRGLPVRNAKLPKNVQPRTPRADVSTQRQQFRTRDVHDDAVIKTVQHGPESTWPGLRGTALAFDAARMRNLSRTTLLHWYQQTYNALLRQQELENRAIAWDADQLKKDSFRVWYQATRNISSFRAEQLARDHRYRRLEQEIEDAQDLRLLTKAFHHWAACAADETDRATQAKQHLLRFRYFAAWKDYMLANELKIRRFCLERWLTRWRDCCSSNERKRISVVSANQKTVLHRAFSSWLMEAQLREHFRRRSSVLKRICVERLVVKFRDIKHAQHIVTDARQRAAILSLQKKLEERHESAEEAVRYDRQRVSRQGFKKIVKQQRVSAQGREIVGRVDWRIAQMAMSRLRYQLLLGKQARIIDRNRLYQTVWRSWSRTLREQVVAKEASNRLKAQCLYRWVLAERCRLLERLRTERLLQRCMVKVVSHWSHQSEHLAEAYILFIKGKRQRIVKSAFDTWREVASKVTRFEGAAVAVDERRLLETAFDTFVVRMERIQLIESQYLPNAKFWFIGTFALERWKAATSMARVRRRHEAYATVRRMVKQNAARKVLLRWQERTSSIGLRNQQSLDARAQALISMATDLFLDWKERWQFINELETRAAMERDRRLKHATVTLWKAESDKARDNLSVALDRDAEYKKRAAYICLRRLHFRISGIQDLYNSRRVTDQVEWSRRRHCRTLVRLWLEATLRRRGLINTDTLATGRTRRIRGLLGQSQIREDQTLLGTASTENKILHSTGLLYEDTNGTPAVPPPATPSRRRFARSTFTPAHARSAAAVFAGDVPARALPIQTEQNPFNMPATVSTESRRVPNRPFGRSTARVLFKPPPDRTAESFP